MAKLHLVPAYARRRRVPRLPHTQRGRAGATRSCLLPALIPAQPPALTGFHRC